MPSPRAESDPVVEVRTVVRTSCPADVTAALPPRAAPPEAGVLRGTVEALAWVSARFRREETLEARIEAARAACVAETAVD